MQTVELALSPTAPTRRTRVLLGQPTAAELAALARDGVRLVLDLRQAGEARGYDEAAAARDAGLGYRNLPVAGAAGMTRENVEAFAAIVDDGANQPLVIHCATANRVGGLVALKAAWRDGLDREAALALGRAAGMRALEPTVAALIDAAR
jgi:uncharacterized protein (TIGR01244 family)